MSQRIAVLGVGTMGEALLSGLLRAGRAPDAVVVADRHADRATDIGQRYGVQVATASDAAAGAGTLLLAVKPQDVATLLVEVGPSVGPAHLVVSIVAGVSTELLQARLPERLPVVRVMTNTPALVGEAMSVLAAGAHAGEEHLARAEALLEPVGRVLRLPEAALDAVTAVSGSGPAYVFYLAEAMIDCATGLGLPPAVALDLVAQTVFGAAALLRESGDEPAALREAVSSPGGTTVAAIGELDEHRVRAGLGAAVQAACERSRALAATPGPDAGGGG